MSEPLTPEALVEMKERVDRATPGPWGKSGDFTYSIPMPVLVAETAPNRGNKVYATPPSGSHPGADTDFIAAARTDLPAALALIGRLLSDLHYTRDELGAVVRLGSAEYDTPAWRSAATALRKEST